ncbi:CoA transferase [Duganella callida]|uniref:Acyl-CoA transferase n=1 Tax=Duganella callida TaxID=2561932 RepID=A0A4Y9S8Q1_9BURK|nr:CoA transferase [Duganella callida]TFW18016.1 acyl-CoA transferase [Duganella callida]
MSATSRQLLHAAWSALDLPSSSLDAVTFVGEGDLPSYFATTDLAAASVAAAALAVRDLMGLQGDPLGAVRVDRRLASLWFGWSIHPVGWTLAPLWDAVAGDYPAADGWIRLHTNAPHHRAAALAVLGCDADRDAVARAVRQWRGGELEAALVARGGCAAAMRSMAEWAAHPQGRAVAAEPLVAMSFPHLTSMEPRRRASMDSRPRGNGAAGAAALGGWRWTAGRPLAGLKVLDLTRVLAGPVATRFLAGYGADVLRIDPPGWNEPGVIPEVTLGKRCARLDLRLPADRARFEDLLAQADILVHGYRPDALERLGFGAQFRRRHNPGLIDVALNAYGWSGPLAGRRGFDSLVQMSCGIAEHGMRQQGADQPVPLPVQALDHATGYLMAAAVVRGLIARLAEGKPLQARLSLARTARWLSGAPAPSGASALTLAPAGAADLAPRLERTEWGALRRLQPPVTIDGAPMAWSRPAASLGSSLPNWD